jgi:hypothetical protein
MGQAAWSMAGTRPPDILRIANRFDSIMAITLGKASPGKYLARRRWRPRRRSTGTGLVQKAYGMRNQCAILVRGRRPERRRCLFVPITAAVQCWRPHLLT